MGLGKWRGRVQIIQFEVIGTPAPQGSKRFLGVRGGKGIMVESSKAVKPWREAVKWSAMEFVRDHTVLGASPTLKGPVQLEVTFTLSKPKSAKRGAAPDKKPDLSKLVRSTEDAISDAGMWEDDARIVFSTSMKVYVGDPGALTVPGAKIRITPWIPAARASA